MADVQRLSTFSHDYLKILLKPQRCSPTDQDFKRQLLDTVAQEAKIAAVRLKTKKSPKQATKLNRVHLLRDVFSLPVCSGNAQN